MRPFTLHFPILRNTGITFIKREQHSLNNPNPTLKDFGTLVLVGIKMQPYDKPDTHKRMLLFAM